MVAKENPLQQGLKLTLTGWMQALSRRRKGKSTTTRIETKLDFCGVKCYLRRKGKSTTTRIETILHILNIYNIYGVAKENPLQQGLKLTIEQIVQSECRESQRKIHYNKD